MLKRLYDILEDGDRKNKKYDEIKREYEGELGSLMYHNQ